MAEVCANRYLWKAILTISFTIASRWDEISACPRPRIPASPDFAVALPLHFEPTALAIQEVRHDQALVRREAIPNQDRFGSMEVPFEILQKGDQTFRVVGADARLEEEAVAPAVPAVAERRADRETGPVESVDQDRGFAFRCPGSPDGWALGYSAFVLEEDPRSPATSVFFTAGHFSDIQSLIASEFRSLACLAGRCSVQSITPRIFQTWPG